MNLIKEMIKKGSLQDRLNTYFENLCMESIKEGRGYGGFLSSVEKKGLFETFSNEKTEREAFNRHVEVYSKLVNIIGKLGLLELELNCTATQLLWMKISLMQLDEMVESLNSISLKLQEKGELFQFSSNTFMANVVRDRDGVFNIEYTESNGIKELVLRSKDTGEYQVKNLKTALYAVNKYMERNQFKSETYSEIINDIEEKCSISAGTIGLIYSDIDIEKDYFEWFDSYFLR